MTDEYKVPETLQLPITPGVYRTAGHPHGRVQQADEGSTRVRGQLVAPDDGEVFGTYFWDTNGHDPFGDNHLIKRIGDLPEAFVEEKPAAFDPDALLAPHEVFGDDRDIVDAEIPREEKKPEWDLVMQRQGDGTTKTYKVGVPDEDGFIGFCGDKCPVAPECLVDVITRNSSSPMRGRADSFSWKEYYMAHAVIAYRLVDRRTGDSVISVQEARRQLREQLLLAAMGGPLAAHLAIRDLEDVGAALVSIVDLSLRALDAGDQA